MKKIIKSTNIFSQNIGKISQKKDFAVSFFCLKKLDYFCSKICYLNVTRFKKRVTFERIEKSEI
jgi:hypothetical protein